jgi:hypothetical protein
MSPTSTQNNSTIMDPILDSIAAIDSAEPGEHLSYCTAGTQFNVNPETLRRRHKGQQLDHAGAANNKQLLSPQQEIELVQYINELTEEGLPPTRSMIQNFGSAVAPWPCSKRWVLRFLCRNSAHLCSKWSVGMDKTRVKADSEHSYHHYFELLHAKIQQYDIAPWHIYNMDEKGFLAGVTSRQKRIFSRQLWEQKKVTAGLQDGSREWITILALVCADRSSLDPSVLFEAKGGLRTGWVHDIEPEKHQVFFTTSPTGWSNDDIGLAWLEQVFDRRTKDKARSSYRILIVDGHGSHLTRDFLKYCLAHKILLCILLPHSTHSLQPLDVVLFGPLSRAYTVKLSDYLQCSKGLLPVRKQDFFLLFWDAYITSFTRDNILKSFEATGIEPHNASVVLNRFRTPTPQPDDGTKLGEHGDGDTWRDVRKLFEAAVPDTLTVEAKQLSQALHSFQVKNEVVHKENHNLCASVNTKKKRTGRGKDLQPKQQKEFQSNAVFYSPSTLRKGFELQDQKARKKEAKQLQKNTRRP